MLRNWTLSAAMYGGIALILLGLLHTIRPWTRWHLSRRLGLGMVVVGAVVTTLLPALTKPRRQTVNGGVPSRMDDAIPAWDFAEVHKIDVAASPQAVDAAIRTVSPHEMPIFRVLTWIRSPALVRRAEDILDVPSHRPIIAVATATTFVVLADVAGREIVFGTLLGGRRRPTAAEFLADRSPGVSKAVMNFRIVPLASGACRLVTETRVASADDSSRRAFDYYWRFIFPGSAIIRREWLGAIKTRAELKN